MIMSITHIQTVSHSLQTIMIVLYDRSKNHLSHQELLFHPREDTNDYVCLYVVCMYVCMDVFRLDPDTTRSIEGQMSIKRLQVGIPVRS
jgi:hypothetical protein